MTPVVPQSSQKPNSTALRAQRGSALVECGICIALVAVVCISATTGVGRSISDLFQRASSEVQGGGSLGTEPEGGGTTGGGKGTG